MVWENSLCEKVVWKMLGYNVAFSVALVTLSHEVLCN